MLKLAESPYKFYFKIFRRPLSLGMIALLVTNLLDAFHPLIIGRTIDSVAGLSQDSTSAWTNVAILTGLTVGLALFRYFWRIYWGTFHQSVANHLRGALFSRFSVLSLGFYRSRPIGELMSLMTSDVNSFRTGIGPGLLTFADGLMLLVFIPPMMMSISLSWTWKCLILMPLVPFFIHFVSKKIFAFYKVQQDQFAELSGIAQETIQGIRVLKSFALEKSRTQEFNKKSKTYEDACNRVAKTDSYFEPVMDIGISLGSVVLLVFGAQEVIEGKVSIGSFFAFYQYIDRMIWPMTALGLGLTRLQEGNASFSRIKEVLTHENDIKDNGHLQLTQFDKLEVKALDYQFTDAKENTLKNISFQLKKGHTLAIFGPTGTGKTTLVHLLVRLLEAPAHSIWVNDHPIEDYTLSSLRNILVAVPQDTFIFAETLKENILLGLTASETSIQEVTERVALAKEIESMPSGIDSSLGEKGVNLSGGQRQRLAMARALIRNSPFLILDDSLSAVDSETEAAIVERLKTNSDRTTILISHRISNLKWADQVLVLRNGEVETLGDPKQVLSTSSTFQLMSKIQEGHQ